MQTLVNAQPHHRTANHLEDVAFLDVMFAAAALDKGLFVSPPH